MEAGRNPFLSAPSPDSPVVNSALAAHPEFDGIRDECEAAPMRRPGNEVFLSGRVEALRDGVADYELLRQLARTDPETANRLASRFVLDFDDYHIDTGDFRLARRELLEALDSR